MWSINFLSRSCLAALAISLAGCSTINVQKTMGSNADPVNVVFIDAKQRAVVTGNVKNSRDSGSRQVFCAEPSPDAISAISASLGGGLSVAGQGDLNVSSNISEAAAYIGMRTAAIQALRDITYRNCEAYLNGGITEVGLETLNRRFQSTLVAVLAIEQLTGAVKASTVVLNPQSGAGLEAAVKSLSDTSTALIEAKAADEKATVDLATANKALTAAGTDTAAQIYKDAKAAVDTAKATVKATNEALKQAQSNYDAGLKLASTLAGVTNGGANSIGDTSTTRNLDALGLQAVASAVQNIVTDTLSLGFGREVCTTVFGRMISTADITKIKSQPNELETQCLELLKKDVDVAAANIDYLNSYAALLKAVADGKIAQGNAVDLIPKVPEPGRVGIGYNPLSRAPSFSVVK